MGRITAEATAMHKWVLPVPVPPCRKKLERDKDYDLPPIMW